MTLWRNRLSDLGLADGTDITTGNSSANGGQAFTLITKTSLGTVKYVSARNTIACNDVGGGSVARAEVLGLWSSDVCSLDVRGWGDCGTIVGGDSRIIEVRNPSGSAARIEVDDTTRSIYFIDSSGSNIGFSTGVVLPAADYWRIEIGLKRSTGEARCRLYLASSGYTATPAWDSGLVAGKNLGAADFSGFYLGQINTAAGGVPEFDYWQLNDATVDPIGPWLVPPVVAGTPQDTLGFDLAGLASGGAGSPFTIDSVTQTSGTTVTGLDYATGSDDLRGWCDRESVVDTCTFDVVVLDSDLVPATAFEVTLAPATGRAGGSRVWDNDLGLYVN